MTESDNTKRNLDRFVSQMRDSGRVHSTGVFTLDPQKALQKLREFQTVNPYEYVLSLFSTAFLGKAKKFRLDRGIDRTVIRFDGDPLTYEEMNQILTDGLNQVRTRSGYLAVALSAAFKLSPSELFLESHNIRLEYRNDEFEFKELKEPVTENRFGMLFDRSVSRLFSKAGTEERQLLGTRCHHSGIKATFNDEQCYPPTRAKTMSADAILHLSREGEYDFFPTNRSDIMTLRRESPGFFSARVGFSPDDGSRSGSLVILMDGVNFDKKIELPFPLQGEVSSSTLTLDLSRQNIISNLAFKNFETQLRRVSEDFAADYLENYESQTAWRKRATKSKLTPLMNYWSDKDPDRAARCQALITRYHNDEGQWFDSLTGTGVLHRIAAALGVNQLIRREGKTPKQEPQSEAMSRLGQLVFGGLLLVSGKFVLGGALLAYQAWRISDEEKSNRVEVQVQPRARHQPRIDPQTEELVSSLLKFYDNKSAVRFGRNHWGNEKWWSMDGTLMDGTQMLLRYSGGKLHIDLTPLYPYSLDFTTLKLGATLRNDGRGGQVIWTTVRQVVDETCGLVSQTLDTYRRLQAEQQLPCAICRKPMEKVVLDVVIDRCAECGGAWFDHRESEYLFSSIPIPKKQLSGHCPRCETALSSDLGKLYCPQCGGVWIEDDSLVES